MEDNPFAQYNKDLEKKCYKVKEITFLIKNLLEGEFPNITVEGEISNFRPSSTGHYYFSLKDTEAMLSAVMFKSKIPYLQFMPADGMLVKAKGNISVYPKRGNYQLICDVIEKAGTGDILAMLDARKKKLAREGLFDEARKKPLPLLPSRVAVITSPTGAAIRDILRVLRRRHSGINLVLLPAPVQGDEAAPVITRQIRIANLHSLGEVLIIGRGGGSLEDLLPFYEEEVVRAIADSDIPVISAVGHEIDITLTDLAADVRAPTPSAAAELVSASRDELIRRVTEAKNRIIQTLDQRIDKIRILLSQFAPESLERSFRQFIQPILFRFDDAKEAILAGLKETIREYRHRLAILEQKIIANSPLDILKKGYALVTDIKSGKLLTSPDPVEKGDDIHIRLYKGELSAQVKEKKKHEKF